MENIEVLLRIRPISPSEQLSDMSIWEANGNTVGIPNERYEELVRMRKMMPGLKNAFNFSKYINMKFPFFLFYFSYFRIIMNT